MLKLRHFFSRRGLLLFLWLTLVVIPLTIVLHFFVEPQPRWTVQAPQVQLVSLSTDGSRLVAFRSGENRSPLEVWDTATGEKIGSFLRSAGPFSGHVPATPDRYFAATLRDQHIVLVDMKQAWEKTLPIKGSPVAFSPTERFLVVEDRTITGDRHLVDTATGKVVEGLKWQEWYSFSPNDERLFYLKIKAGEDEPCVHIWDCRQRTEKAVSGIRAPIVAAPDGQTFLVAKDGHPDTGGFEITVLWNAQTGKTRRFETLGVGKYDTNDAEFSPDSKIVVLKDEGTLRFWDVATAKFLSKVKLARWFIGAQFTPDGRKYVGFDNGANSLVAWNPQNGQRIWARTWPQELDGLVFGFHDNGRALLVSEGGYHCLDANTGDTRFTMDAGMPISPFIDAPDARFPKHTRNDRHLVTYEMFHDPVQEMNFWDKLSFWKSRPAFVPLPHFVTWRHRLKVLETTSGRQVAEVSFDEVADGLVCEAGKILITAETKSPSGSGAVMRCWDLPLRAPWFWVYGPPAAAFVVGLLAFRFWKKRAPLAA
jgi:WD40 repeat protein